MVNLFNFQQSLKNDGFVIIRQCFDKAFLKDMEAEIDNFTKNNFHGFKTQDFHYVPGTNKISTLHNLNLYSSVYSDFLKNKKNFIYQFAKFHFNDEINVLSASYFAKPAKCGIATKAHQDNSFFNIYPGEKVITCWFGLDAVDISNGGLYYYKGSQVLGNLFHETKEHIGDTMPINKSRRGAAFQVICEIDKSYESFPKFYVSLKPGDCVIHDSLVVHGSDSNKSPNPRRGFNFSYASKVVQIDHERFNNYQNNLANFRNNVV